MKELFDAITVLKARSNPENWDDVLRVQRAADALQQQLAAAREAHKADAWRLDWLNSHCGEAFGFEGEHLGNRWHIEGAYENIRDAIDGDAYPATYSEPDATLQRNRQP